MNFETALKRVYAALADCGVAANRPTVVGSTYITGETASDIDILVLVDRHPDELSFAGWVYGGSGSDYHDNWGSWKFQDGGTVINMLLTNSEMYHEAWCTAAEVCRLLHITGVSSAKDLRIAIHNIIMDDACAEDERHRIAAP